jgi:hypothetical protein
METRQPARVGGWCSWHEAYDRTARPVRELEDQGSGHGTGDLSACASCREAYELTPIGSRT